MIETVREQIDYPLLAMSYMNDDPDCILELICHVLCSTAPNLKIGSETIPTPKVQARFRRLRFEHAAYAMQKRMRLPRQINRLKRRSLNKHRLRSRRQSPNRHRLLSKRRPWSRHRSQHPQKNPY